MNDRDSVRLGLRENRRQFALLVAINAFVGAMVGLERTVLPLLAETEFGIRSHGAMLSFIASFGLVKALTNFAAGRLGDTWGRRRALIVGWLFGLPVPLLVMWAPSWGWIVFANLLLGVNQGLAWSMTVIMKIDLVGPRQRGLAMGLNEFAGYLAVALAALTTGIIAESTGLRPEPFYIGIAVAAVGLALSVLFVRDTADHVAVETRTHVDPTASPDDSRGDLPSARAVFIRASWRDPALFSASQAGLVNNLNDGLAWGLFPVFFAAAGLSVRQIGVLSFVYPAVWGVLQLWTGALSDKWGRKPFIVSGMTVQAIALFVVAASNGYGAWLIAAALLGVGTAMVYPVLLASIGDVAPPVWRASAIGVYRFWRDSGYVVGALLAGVLADVFGIATAIVAVAGLTLASGAVVAWRMPETVPMDTGPG